MVMPLGNDAIVRAHIPDGRLATGDWWDAITLAPGIATTLTPAVHWSNRSLADRRMARWSGHFLATPVGTVWFAGDTGFGDGARSEEHTSELQSLMRISYAVFCLQKKNINNYQRTREYKK